MKFHGSWRPSEDDIGSRVLHWDYHLTSSPMPTTIFEDDVVVSTSSKSSDRNSHETGFRTKAPMLSGSGRYMRLLGLLGCARGVGDFGTVASCRSVPVKPFLTSRPDVEAFNFDSSDDETYVVLASDGVWDALNVQQISDVVFRNIEEYRLLFDDTTRSSNATKRVSSKTVFEAARASGSRKSLLRPQTKPTLPPPVIPPPPTRRFRKQRYGMKMFHKKFQDGPLMAAAAEILRMATCVSRSAGVRPSGDDLTCFVIPANRSSDAFMSRYEKRSSKDKPPKISEKPSVEMCVRKLVRNMYHSYHFVITDSYNSNTNRYVSGTKQCLTMRTLHTQS